MKGGIVSVFEFVQAILSIVVIDLVLSGDNAVVIGMAARRLSPEQGRSSCGSSSLLLRRSSWACR
jgi:predicted tellurium resistance membrane protein TerC